MKNNLKINNFYLVLTIFKKKQKKIIEKMFDFKLNHIYKESMIFSKQGK